MGIEDREKSKSLSASEVATLLAGKPKGSKDMCKFGEIFHERFSFHEYQQDQWMFKYGFRKFCRRLAAACREAELGGEWTMYGIRLAAAFIAKGAEGRTPPTEHIELAKGVVLYAKPDLVIWNTSPRYIELKTQLLTEYDRLQSAMFGLALGTEITLMAPKNTDGKWIEVVVEKIQPYPKKEQVIELIKTQGREEENWQKRDIT